MKKSELINKLNSIGGDFYVVIAADSEGNWFEDEFRVVLSPLSGSGEPCHPDDADDSKEKVIVLWP